MARAASFAEQVADLLDQEGRASAEHSASRSATGASRSIGAIVEAGWLWECAVARNLFFLRWQCHRPLTAAGEAKLNKCSEELRFYAMTSLFPAKTRRITET